jgi:hypothetical protein
MMPPALHFLFLLLILGAASAFVAPSSIAATGSLVNVPGNDSSIRQRTKTSARVLSIRRVFLLSLSVLSDREDLGDNEDGKDMPPPEELLPDVRYESSIDWDAEWKKVKTGQGQPNERPGKNFYKNEAEIAAIKAANRAADAAQRQYNRVRMPSFASLQGDWRVRCPRGMPLSLCLFLCTR